MLYNKELEKNVTPLFVQIVYFTCELSSLGNTQDSITRSSNTFWLYILNADVVCVCVFTGTCG